MDLYLYSTSAFYKMEFFKEEGNWPVIYILDLLFPKLTRRGNHLGIRNFKNQLYLV
jgi:hypothetical protein